MRKKLVFLFFIAVVLLSFNPFVFGLSDTSIKDIHYTNNIEPTVIVDSDDDLLSNSAEWYLGTDPYNKDTDSDGFIDGMEVNPNTKIGSTNVADPLRKNIFIEIDRLNDTQKVNQRELSKLKRMFAQSPIQNPDGSTGITVYVRTDNKNTTDVLDTDTISLQKYRFTYHRPSINKTRYYGFYHVLITDESIYESDQVNGVTDYSLDGMLVTSDPTHEEASIIAHELGHQLGLTHNTYSGIDSHKKSWESYPSVMNYNKKPTCTINLNDTVKFNCYTNHDVYSYSNGTGYPDWQHIEDNLAQNQATMKFEKEDTTHTVTVFDLIQDR